MPTFGEGTQQQLLAAQVVSGLPAVVGPARATITAGLATLGASYARAATALAALAVGQTPAAGAIEDAMVALVTAAGLVAAQAEIDQLNTYITGLQSLQTQNAAMIAQLLQHATP